MGHVFVQYCAEMSAACVTAFTNRTNYPFIWKDGPALLFLQRGNTAHEKLCFKQDIRLSTINPPSCKQCVSGL